MAVQLSPKEESAHRVRAVEAYHRMHGDMPPHLLQMSTGAPLRIPFDARPVIASVTPAKQLLIHAARTSCNFCSLQLAGVAPLEWAPISSSRPRWHILFPL